MITIRRDPARVDAFLAAELSDHKIQSVQRINATIGAVRQRFITTAPGQEMIYLSKETEARACIAEADPDPADYPLLAAEIGITAPDLQSVAQTVMNLAAIWRLIGAQLEQIRLLTSAQISAATSVEAVNAVVTDFHDTLSSAI